MEEGLLEPGQGTGSREGQEDGTWTVSNIAYALVSPECHADLGLTEVDTI